MCGITGFIAGQDVTVDSWFTDAVHCVNHRGPDRELTWLRGDMNHTRVERLGQGPRMANAGLGFARLAIIDLSEASDQPFVEPGRATLVLNGEIYNYIELRDELEARGWRFSSSGDAEVLLKAYLEWGLDALPKLNGMFALAIHDEERGSLVLARDRFGEKPLIGARGVEGSRSPPRSSSLPAIRGSRSSWTPMLLGRISRRVAHTSGSRAGSGDRAGGSRIVARLRGRRHRPIRELLRPRAPTLRAVRPERTPAAWADRFSIAFAVGRSSCGSGAMSRWEPRCPPASTARRSSHEAAEIGHERYHAFTLRYDDARDEELPPRRWHAAAGASWHPVWATGDEFARSWDAMTWHHETPGSRRAACSVNGRSSRRRMPPVSG